MKEVIITVLASGAFFTFLQFLISRYDLKKGLEHKMDDLSNKVEENQAILARTHILRFADELRNGVAHSDDYFKQQLQDIDVYEHYCQKHPDFANGLTVLSAQYIKDEFTEQLKGENK